MTEWSLLDRARELGTREGGLVVVVTTRAGGSAQASVVNAGIVEHPVTGEPVVGFVVQGGTRRKPPVPAGETAGDGRVPIRLGFG